MSWTIQEDVIGTSEMHMNEELNVDSYKLKDI